MDNESIAPARDEAQRRPWRDRLRRSLPAGRADAGAGRAGPPLASGPILATARRLLDYARAHRAAVVASVLLFFASSAIDPLVPAFFKWLLDHGFKPESRFPLWLIPLIVVGLFAVRGLLGFGGSYLLARSTSDAVLLMRTDLVRSVMRADASLYLH